MHSYGNTVNDNFAIITDYNYKPHPMEMNTEIRCQCQVLSKDQLRYDMCHYPILVTGMGINGE